MSQPSSSSLLVGAGKGASELSCAGSWMYPLLPNGFKDWSLETTEFEGCDVDGCPSGALRDHAKLFMESRNAGEAMLKETRYSRAVFCTAVYVSVSESVPAAPKW